MRGHPGPVKYFRIGGKLIHQLSGAAKHREAVAHTKMTSSNRWKSRFRQIANTRLVMTNLIREFRPGLTLAEMARFMNRDHTTIIYHLRNLENRIAADEYTRQLYTECKRRLRP